VSPTLKTFRLNRNFNQKDIGPSKILIRNNEKEFEFRELVQIQDETVNQCDLGANTIIDDTNEPSLDLSSQKAKKKKKGKTRKFR